MRKALVTVLVILVLGLLITSQAGTTPETGAIMEDFTIRLLDGSDFTLSQHLGKAVFVNVWATWCGPCAAEIPDLQKISKEYSETLVILGLNCGEDEQTVRNFLNEHGVTYPQALDVTGDFINATFPTEYIPYTVVIGADGTVIVAETGLQSYDTFLGWYQTAISSVAGQHPQVQQAMNTPAGDEPETIAEASGLRYKVRNREAVVTGYSGNETNLVIPASLGGCPVTAIGANAFQYNGSLESVKLPGSVRSIGDVAFDQCFSLCDINFPSGLTSIGKCAFGNCFALTRVVIPGGVAVIPENCFWGCVGLQVVLMEEGVQEIEINAFAGLENLRIVYLPRSLKSIHEIAFENNTALNALYAYPDSYAARWAKSGGREGALLIVVPESDLQYEVLEDSVTILNYFGSEATAALPWTIEGKPVRRLGDGGFNFGLTVHKLYVPESVQTIGSICGRDSVIQEICIPSNVTSIDEHAFTHSPLLRSITVDPLNEIYFSKNGVLFRRGMCWSLDCYPCGKEDAFYEIPDGTVEIDSWAMMGTRHLQHLTIPASVSFIGRQALAYGKALASVTVDVGNPHFYAADGVLFSREPDALVQYPRMRKGDAYKIPAGISEVLICAFYECRLGSIEFPDSLTYIGDMAFMDSNLLRDIRFNDGLLKIDSQAFDYCCSLESVRIPSSVKEISNFAFNADYLQKAIVEDGSYAQQWFMENGFAEKIEIASLEEARNIREAYNRIVAGQGLEKRVEAGESFDFYTGESGSYLGGDFYYGSLGFFGNNGQRGIAKIGKADSVYDLSMPSEYTQFGVPAVKGWYYVSLSSQGEGYFTLLKATGVGEKWVSVVYCNFHE